MAVNTSDKKIVITDNAVERIECIDEGGRFAIIWRGRVNGSKPDSVTILSLIEAKDLANFIRDRLYERFK